MKQFYLAEIVTKDKLIHQGIFYPPSHKASGGKPNRAILWIHGLTSTFYGSVKLLETFADACEKAGYAFAAFNNRGHDIVTGIKKLDKCKAKGYVRANGGAGYEDFTQCIYDIDAGISFLQDQGYTEVFLVGHSTGANKVCYYAGKRRDGRVTGVILASPASDRLDPSLDKQKHTRDIVLMKQYIKEGKGDELMVGVHVFPATPKRFVSSFDPNSSEDVFDYGDPKPKLTLFSKIHKPLLIVIGSHDEYLDRPAETILDMFAKHTNSSGYQSIVISGALHSFNGKEQEVVSAMFRWTETI